MKEISRREFVLNICKYLREKGLYRLVGKKEELEVEIRAVSLLNKESEEVLNKMDKKLEMLNKKEEAEVFPVRSDNKALTEYGCGCKRVEGKVYCPAHGRM